MKRFKNILFLWNRELKDDAALMRARELAKRNKGRLTVVQVVPSFTASRSWSVDDKRIEELEFKMLTETKAYLKGLAQTHSEQGVIIKSEVLVGTPFLCVIREVIKKGYDLVMMTAEGKVGLKEQFFGSTSMHLMRKCPCPVWVIKKHKESSFQRILAAVDPDVEDKQKTLLNVKILELASSLAHLEEGILHIVHVWDVWGSARTWLSDSELDQLERQEKRDRKRQLDDLIKERKLDDLEYHVHLPEGRTRDLIPEVVAKHHVDLVVMGTVCRTGISGFIIGNTAEDILQQVECSVLTVKPDKFVSPVKCLKA